MVLRALRSGTLYGLRRCRGFAQDDSQFFGTPDQPPQVIQDLVWFVMSVLRAVGFEDFTASLSTRPPEKSVGTDEGWAAAEAALEAALKAEGVEYDIDEGGGAFYGPKIDVKVRDEIGRAHV